MSRIICETEVMKRVPIVHFRLLERPTGASDAEKRPPPPLFFFPHRRRLRLN